MSDLGCSKSGQGGQLIREIIRLLTECLKRQSALFQRLRHKHSTPPKVNPPREGFSLGKLTQCVSTAAGIPINSTYMIIYAYDAG